MREPKTIYVKTAYETINEYLKNRKTIEKESSEIDKELLVKRSCFVTIHNNDNSLRGCIGTIIPVRENLYQEIVHNAIAASTQDPRFEPMELEELANVYISVDVLSELHEVKELDELDPKIYGVVVSDRFRRGVLLPDLEGVDTVEEQLRIVKLKAGIYGRDNKGIKIEKFTVTRYF